MNQAKNIITIQSTVSIKSVCSRRSSKLGAPSRYNWPNYIFKRS